MAQWTFIAQNVVILCSQRCSELTLRDIENYARNAVLPTLGTAQRVSYRHWELRKECLTDVGTSANTLSALQSEWGSSIEPWKRPTDKMPPIPMVR
jgi:hypothetical protein